MFPHLRAARPSPWALCASFVLTASSCGMGDSVPVVEGVIDRETFIATYVDVRAETLNRAELNLSSEERDSVLSIHGVDAESLLAFVDAYGRDLDYMNEVWAEIESRLEARPAASLPGMPPR